MFVIKAALVLLVIEKIVQAHNTPASPPIFASQHPNVYVFETDENGNLQNLTLPCSIAAPSSTVEYTWYRGNKRLPGSMVNGEGTLVIPNITEGEYASREGVEYYCIASDNIGYSVAVRSRTITVYYAYFDGFERMTESTIQVPVPVAQNSDVALECDVLDANPPPQIKWYDDQGEVQEIRQSNNIRFLDNKRYLFIRRLQPSHLERQYYCSVSNVNLSHEISAPTRYVLVDNLTQGKLRDYKQIGDLRAFVGNESFEFTYVGGVFGDNINGTTNRLFVNISPVEVLGNIGTIDISSTGSFMLKADVNYNGIMTTRNGTLTVNQVPNITSTFRDEREHLVGEKNLMYTCEFVGLPLPSIAFYFNGSRITAGNIYGVNIVGNTLTIPSPQVSHSGVYQCIVSNEFGDDQAAWLLVIRQPASPQVQPYNFTSLDAFADRDLGALIVRDNGSTVSFSVDVIARPCPDIEWIFNGTRLEADDNTVTFNNPCMDASSRSTTWTFTLNVMITRATSGSYSAKLSNTAGNTQLPKTIYLTIPENVSVIDLSLNDTCLKEGSNVALRCNVRGFPRPMIEFQLNGTTIKLGVGGFENEFYDQIAIMNVTMSARGEYTCIATSVSGPSQEVTQRFVFCTEPVITGVNRTSNPRIGESFFIECTFIGMPPPAVVWRKDGAELSEMDDNIKIVPTDTSSRLEITEAISTDFNGMYECNITNVAGFTSQSFQIELQDGSLHLSPGAIAGIVLLAVGTIVGLLVIFGVTAYCYLKSKFDRVRKEGRIEGEEIAKEKYENKHYNLRSGVTFVKDIFHGQRRRKSEPTTKTINTTRLYVISEV